MTKQLHDIRCNSEWAPYPDHLLVDPELYRDLVNIALPALQLSPLISEVAFRSEWYGCLVRQSYEEPEDEDRAVLHTSESGHRYVEYDGDTRWVFATVTVSRPSKHLTDACLVRVVWYEKNGSSECWADMYLEVQP